MHRVTVSDWANSEREVKRLHPWFTLGNRDTRDMDFSWIRSISVTHIVVQRVLEDSTLEHVLLYHIPLELRRDRQRAVVVLMR